MQNWRGELEAPTLEMVDLSADTVKGNIRKLGYLEEAGRWYDRTPGERNTYGVAREPGVSTPGPMGREPLV
jgi:hypothetical protein